MDRRARYGQLKEIDFMITGAEIRQCLRAVLRWWWVIVVAVALASGMAFFLTIGETRFYIAHASLMIGNTLESQLPDQSQISIGSALARYYGELARREPILKPVQEKLQLPFPWQVLSDRMLSTNVIPSANLLEIYVTDSNPERAAWTANAIGDQLIAFSPTSPEKIQAEQAAVEQQLRASDTKIQDLQQQIADLTEQQNQATSASDLAEINQKLAQLNTSLAQEQTSYKSLLNYKSSSVVNSLSFFEPATPPTAPLPSKRKVLIGSAGLAGGLLALLAIYVLELLDNRVRGPRDIEGQFRLPTLGTIPIGPPLLAAPEAFAVVRLEATREAQTNIMLAAAERGTRLLMITSPQPSEARTAFSLDLADLFARSGHKVLIVDADSTQSFLTRMLLPHGISNTQNPVPASDHTNIWAYMQPTPLQNVALLPGQTNPSGAPAMLPSLRWRELVGHLRDAADVIIFDGPAALSGPDAALLAPHLDGVVLALDPATDSRELVSKSKERLLHQNGTHLLGAVTFIPASQQFDVGSVWRQLRGQSPRLLAVPDAPATSWAGASARAANGPIITPAPAHVPVPDHDTRGPIINPPPTDAEPIVMVADPEQVIEIGQLPALDVEPLPPPDASAQAPRKAARSPRRSKRTGDSAS
jgi:Mrp family chromosome partitioning ATPase